MKKNIRQKNTNKKKSVLPSKAKIKRSDEDIKKEAIEIISNLTKISKEKIEKYNKENFTDLGIDSFALVEVIFSIENTFGIDIPQDSLANVKNIDDLVKLIKQLINKNG